MELTTILSQLISARRLRDWRTAYSRLAEAKRAATTRCDQGWVMWQTAVTQFAESHARVAGCLRLIDNAIEYMGDTHPSLPAVLVDGSIYAQYAVDDVRHRGYIAQMKSTVGSDGPWTGRMLLRMGYYHQGKEQLRQAEAYFMESFRFYEEHVGPHGEHDQRCQIRYALTACADVTLAQGWPSEAASLYRMALGFVDEAKRHEVLYLEGRLAQHEGDAAAAETSYRACIASARTSAEHTLVVRATEACAELLASIGSQAKISELVVPLIDELIEANVPSLVLRLQRMTGSNTRGEVIV